MTKDFDTWNTLKKELENENMRIVHEGQIWWCSLGLNIGHEQDGKNQKYERPVLIIKKFNNAVVWTIPLSTKIKEGPIMRPSSMSEINIHVSSRNSDSRVPSVSRDIYARYEVVHSEIL